MVALNSDDTMPVALIETKNQEGLNYMVLATKCSQDEGSYEGPLCPKESRSSDLKKDKKQSQADKDFCQEPQVAYSSPGQSEGLNYACLAHSGHGDVSE